jgi:transcription antitermination factor NusG
MQAERVLNKGASLNFQAESLGDSFVAPHWYALYTRSRHEKSVYDAMRQSRIETFLPLRRISRRWSDRTKHVLEPLFRGYVFVRIPLLSKLDVLKVHGAVRFVSRGGHAIPVPERELSMVRQFVDKEIEMDPFPYLACGARVRVTRGVMKGVEGILVQKMGQCRLVLSLDMLYQSVSVEIDASYVQALR